MSDTMLLGVLKMPYDMAMESELSRRQFYDRVQQLLDRHGTGPEPEPVGWVVETLFSTGEVRFHGRLQEGRALRAGQPLYAAPKPLRPLSTDEIIRATDEISTRKRGYFIDIARAIERAHGIE